jgi:hypothetical protein
MGRSGNSSLMPSLRNKLNPSSSQPLGLKLLVLPQFGDYPLSRVSLRSCHGPPPFVLSLSLTTTEEVDQRTEGPDTSVMVDL